MHRTRRASLTVGAASDLACSRQAQMPERFRPARSMDPTGWETPSHACCPVTRGVYTEAEFGQLNAELAWRIAQATWHSYTCRRPIGTLVASQQGLLWRRAHGGRSSCCDARGNDPRFDIAFPPASSSESIKGLALVINARSGVKASWQYPAETARTPFHEFYGSTVRPNSK